MDVELVVMHNTLHTAVKVAFIHQVELAFTFESPPTHTIDALADLTYHLDLAGPSSYSLPHADLDTMFALSDLADKATQASTTALSDWYHSLADELYDVL